MKPTERIQELQRLRLAEIRKKFSSEQWVDHWHKYEELCLVRAIGTYLDEQADFNEKRAHVYAALSMNAPKIGLEVITEINRHAAAIKERLAASVGERISGVRVTGVELRDGTLTTHLEYTPLAYKDRIDLWPKDIRVAHGSPGTAGGAGIANVLNGVAVGGGGRGAAAGAGDADRLDPNAKQNVCGGKLELKWSGTGSEPELLPCADCKAMVRLDQRVTMFGDTLCLHCNHRINGPHWRNYIIETSRPEPKPPDRHPSDWSCESRPDWDEI